ncbi:MAG: hypothetical protein A2138_08295 [Deltaproteobacteria bacterium RBG_16_71_12]|nr:MAG: hypothetical protein A2138_08295 [Deltaproteobacteria bacterium RBG_16_71_12]
MDAMRPALLLVPLLVAGACPVAAPPAAVCAACVQEKCSELSARCSADADCACVEQCFGAAGVPGIDACIEGCGLAARPALFFDVEECAAAACPDAEDECATPAGYQPPDDGTVLTTTAPIGGGSLADCGLDDTLPFDPASSIIQLQSIDGSVCVRLERRDDGPGDAANTAWTLLRARLGPLGSVADVDDAAALCWYSSHHNFADWAHVWTGTRRHDVHLEVFGWGGLRSYALHTFEQGPLDAACSPTADGITPVGAPLALFPYDGTR